MNMNRHAGTLNTALRIGGLRVMGGVIHFSPHVPNADFALRTPLIGGIWRGGKHRGYYAPLYAGLFKFAVTAPAEASCFVLNGQSQELIRDEQGRVRFEAPGWPGERILWEMT